MSHLGERKTDMCISCSENFVFIVEPPAADVCIRGGEVCMGGPSSMPIAQWPAIGRQIKEIFSTEVLGTSSPFIQMETLRAS